MPPAHVVHDGRHGGDADEDQRRHNHQRQQREHDDEHHSARLECTQADRSEPGTRAGEGVVADKLRLHKIDQRLHAERHEHTPQQDGQHEGKHAQQQHPAMQLR